MDELIRRLLDDMGAALSGHARPRERLDLYHIGRTVLTFHYGIKGLTTQDFDVVWMRDSDLEEKARELFGAGTERAKQIGLYLDLVPQGLPPLPNRFRNRCTLVAGPWRVLRLWELEPHDYAATKLKAFRPRDRQDLRLLCNLGKLRADDLKAALESAFAFTMEKDGDEARGRAFANLAKVIAYLEGRVRML